MHDLACFRGRHPVENMGDVPALFQRYASARGRPVDLDAIAYHTVCFLALATIGPMIALVEEHPGGDFIEALSQIGFIGRRPLEAKIGRASCRDRVCQYGYISGVAVSYKKKK